MIRPRHHTILVDAAALTAAGLDRFDAAWRESDWIVSPFGFEEALASWNVAGDPFVVELQVASGDGVAAMESPWLEIGSWGAVPPDRVRSVEFAGGVIDIDCFKARGAARFDRARLRFRSPYGDCRMERFFVCLTDRKGGPPLEGSGAIATPLPTSDLAVPFRSQHVADAALRARICSPTSLSMVLAWRGVERSPEAVAALVHDREHDLYGNWPRSIECAYELGVPGYVTRFSDWSEVAGLFATGQPLIASIGVERGQLDGAPYEQTAGHLIVLRGIDENGDVLVNDPAADDAASGRRVYRREQLDRVWMARGGTAYVLLENGRAVRTGDGS